MIKLLRRIGAVATVDTLLALAGMTGQAVIEGCDLLFACFAAPRGAVEELDREGARPEWARSDRTGWGANASIARPNDGAGGVDLCDRPRLDYWQPTVALPSGVG